MGPRPKALPTPEAPPVAIVGRPNVGKSSLLNKISGLNRALVSPVAGTTRDPVDTLITRDDKSYLLIDTAGIRRKGRVSEPLEKLAVIMALKSLERCQVALLVLDASEGVSAQDAVMSAAQGDLRRLCLPEIDPA